MVTVLLMSSSRQGALGYLEHASDQSKKHWSSVHSVCWSFPMPQLLTATTSTNNVWQERLIHSDSRCDRFTTNPIQSPQYVTHKQSLWVEENTFALLTRLYENGLVDVVRDRVLAGVPYVGWSAGSNVACPTIRTTNDMPIVAPPSLNAMALVPFQINPHFVSGKLPGHHVHSREERLAEFLAFNQNEQLVALPEGTAILRRENRALVMGQHDAVWFRQGGKVASLRTGTEFELTEIMSS